MNTMTNSIKQWSGESLRSWDRFWFTPARPQTLAMIRILAGTMLFYTHLVWTRDLMAFLGRDSWITNDVSRLMHQGSYAFSHWWYIDSPVAIWVLHFASLLVFAMLAVGLFSRASSILAFLITVSYCNRLEGALFGLDQVNAMLAMYLMLAPCGAAYSLDRWLAVRRLKVKLPGPKPTRSANVAIRLIQLHMCILYLFAGVSKMRGETWWDGSALWYAVANLEYQSLDMTWLVHWPILIALVTHVTVFWETFYCVLIWPRLTRPIFLLLAIVVHGGIALSLGMITFGLAMLIGNLAFVSPKTVDRAVARVRNVGAGILSAKRQGTTQTELAPA